MREEKKKKLSPFFFHAFCSFSIFLPPFWGVRGKLLFLCLKRDKEEKVVDPAKTQVWSPPLNLAPDAGAKNGCCRQPLSSRLALLVRTWKGQEPLKGP